MGPSIFRQASGDGDLGDGGVGDESRRYICDSNDAMDCEVIRAIPTTELDQDIIHLVEMMMRGQAVRPVIMTMGKECDDLRGWFIVGERFQDRRRTTTSDYAMKIEKRPMEQRSLAI